MDRNEQWKEIWNRKGLVSGQPLHHVDGFDLLTESQWDAMVVKVTQPLGLKPGDSIMECGCGSGAFLISLMKHYEGLRVTGVDYSESLLNIARQRLPGAFHCADMTQLGFLDDQTFDHTLSFSTFHYLSSEDTAAKAVQEMVRVTRKGGQIFLGEVSDAAKRLEAQRIREVSHRGHQKVSTSNPDHLFLPKEFFHKLAEKLNLDVKIIDHENIDLGDYQAAKYRYSVYLTKYS